MGDELGGGQPAGQPERSDEGRAAADGSDPRDARPGGPLDWSEWSSAPGQDDLGEEAAHARSSERGRRYSAEVARAAASHRRCGFSRCRRPLPAEQRAGKKSEYCPKDVTSWEVEPGVVKACGQMARSERDLAAVIRLQTGADADAPVGVADLDVVELGERVDSVIPAVQPVLGPITSLLEGLTGVRAQVDTDIAAAHAARDQALAKATEADSNAATAAR